MIVVGYSRLNDLVHDVADLIEAAAPDVTPLDRVELNDLLTSYLSSRSVVFVDDE